jgi:hypothetical protein
MGVTKQYLRYTQGPLFGVVGSPKANIVFLDVRGVKGKYCAISEHCKNLKFENSDESQQKMMSPGLI